MSAPASRPVHPCVLSLTDGTRGAEHSTWAHITTTATATTAAARGGDDDDASDTTLPNLVVASASTISVYSVQVGSGEGDGGGSNSSGKLRLEMTFSNLAGTVAFLDRVPCPDRRLGRPDALLVGFAGHPRLVVATVSDEGGGGHLLMAEGLLDLTPALQDACHGAVSPLEQDAVFAATTSAAACACDSSGGRSSGKSASGSGGGSTRKGPATVACVLGGGAAVAVVEVEYRLLRRRRRRIESDGNKAAAGGWMIAEEPYVLPLASLSRSLPHSSAARSSAGTSGGGGGGSGSAAAAAMNATNLGLSMSTGFGDIVSATFLSGYLEPVLVLLHSGAGGRTFPGRLGREDAADVLSSGAPPMYATAMSVSVAHKRTAPLWCRAVPSDAFEVSAIRGCGDGGDDATNPRCVVVGANALIVLDAAGTVQCALAANGWARATCPAYLQASLKPNPLAKLSVSLDGSALAWASPHSAVLSLRTGELYVFQRMADGQWALLPTGSSLGAIGEVEHLAALPLPGGASNEKPSGKDRLLDKIGTNKGAELLTGLLFAGSRLGSSILLGYALESVRMQVDVPVKDEPNGSIKQEGAGVSIKQEMQLNESTAAVVEDEYERLLTMEEEALYAPSGSSNQQEQVRPDLIPPSDDDEGEGNDDGTNSRRKRQRVSTFTVVRCLTPLDSLVNLGPLGKSCLGPISAAPSFLRDELHPPPGPTEALDVFGSPAFVFPAGFGSSGGIALATLPGRDDRMILAEQDCLHVDCVFSLPSNGLVLLGMSEKGGGGARIMRLTKGSVDQDDDENSLDLFEVNLEDWSGGPSENATGDFKLFPHIADLFQATLHGAAEFSDGSFAVLLSQSSADTGETWYAVVILKEAGGVLRRTAESILDLFVGDLLLQTTPFLQHTRSDVEVVSFVCLCYSGRNHLISISNGGNLFSAEIGIEDAVMKEDVMDIDDTEDEDKREMKQFYSNQRVVTVDMFKAPKSLFRAIPQTKGSTQNGTENRDDEALSQSSSSVFDEDDEDLYGLSSPGNASQLDNEERGNSPFDDNSWGDEGTFAALCRQSGKLEVYSVSADGDPQLCWTSVGCGQGVMKLQDVENPDVRLPRSHKVFAREMRFFFCGTTQRGASDSPQALSFCFALETSRGDVELYVAQSRRGSSQKLSFNKVPLKSVFRQSQEQTRHRTKLVRKGIVAKGVGSEDETSFRFNHLHRFHGISGQDGLFAACSRPTWFVTERGRPTMVFHRTRHAAPAGASPRPVSGFCSGFNYPKGGAGGFVTLHDRVGRYGSKRLTAFRGLSKVFTGHGLLSGCHGLCIEKIPMGVTVRQIEFIDDRSVSTGDHPLYAVLVSREIDADQSSWNSDGLSFEERKRELEEKENAKIKKQVEADLGGFDMESEWVEEIEREDCFKVETELGGAPPLREQAYSLWIVDSANKWMVVDSYELHEFEHGMTMKVMNLSDFPDEPGSGSSDLSGEDLPTRLFITVGTGYVDKNGEDVSSKGRILLFEVKRPEVAMQLTSLQVVDLALVHEKNIFHGPVTTLSCLSTEGRNRLVVGAGCDINIEQWGNSKLTQVGFFRATMQILDILLFKNFLLLSDAYDSLHFLVWRESDKSLTLLAKDYDPISIYAAGLMSRGAAMTFLCHDDRQNLQFFQYAPGEAAARGGNKLVCRADFHLGTQTTSFSSHFCRSSLLVHSATPTSTITALKQQDSYFGRSDDDQKLGVFFGTTDGGLGAVVPLSEPVYWRLTALQSVLANALEGDCALSPRAWRLYRRTPRRGGCRSNDRKKGVIDGDLVVRYTDLPKADQEDLAGAIGSTVDLILDNILEVQCGSMML